MLKQEVYEPYFVVMGDYAFLNSFIMPIKKAFLSDYFLHSLFKHSNLLSKILNIIGQVDINQIFLLQYSRFYYKLNYLMSYLFYELEVVKNHNLIKNSF